MAVDGPSHQGKRRRSSPRTAALLVRLQHQGASRNEVRSRVLVQHAVERRVQVFHRPGGAESLRDGVRQVPVDSRLQPFRPAARPLRQQRVEIDGARRAELLRGLVRRAGRKRGAVPLNRRRAGTHTSGLASRSHRHHHEIRRKCSRTAQETDGVTATRQRNRPRSVLRPQAAQLLPELPILGFSDGTRGSFLGHANPSIPGTSVSPDGYTMSGSSSRRTPICKSSIIACLTMVNGRHQPGALPVARIAHAPSPEAYTGTECGWRGRLAIGSSRAGRGSLRAPSRSGPRATSGARRG